MRPEEKARKKIDQLLAAAGWQVQDYQDVHLAAARGVAVRSFPLLKGLEADYLLFVDGKAAGVLEAKPFGTPLSGVAEQSNRYAFAIPRDLAVRQLPLPFIYESTGVETFCRDLRDPDPRSRRIFTFQQPEMLQEWLAQSEPLRARLQHLPPLRSTGLRECQIEAITGLEKSLAAGRPRSLVQMATGSGKTFMAVSQIYRLIKFAEAKRVLFLVDRNNLGRQTLTEFQQYLTPDDGRKFTELYNVQRLTSNHSSKVETARPNVSLTDLNELTIPLPPLKEQDEIIKEIERFGQLVPQDPADEPAEKLLARLRAARQPSDASPRKRAALKKPGKLW